MTSSKSRKDQVQDLLNDLHGDVDLDNPDLDLDIDQQTTDLNVTELTVTRPILAHGDQLPIELTEDIQGKDGQVLSLTVRKRERCPHCNWVPEHPAEHYLERNLDPPEIKGRCTQCGVLTCTDCQTRCDTCDQPMGGGCSDGFGAQELTLCPKHRKDVVDERRFEMEIQNREQHRKDEAMILEHETRREVAFRELELQYREQELRHQEQAHKERVEMLQVWLQAQDQITRQQLEIYQTKVQEELDRRQQMIDLYEITTSHQLERDKLEFHERQHEDEMEMREREHLLEQKESKHQRRLAEERQQLQQFKAMVDAADKLGTPQERQKAADKLASTVNQMRDRPELASEITVK
jgi:hypothetical protein